MSDSRKLGKLWVFVLLFGLMAGMAHADDGSSDEMNLDPRNQPATEYVMADLANDSNVTVGTASLDAATASSCDSDTTVASLLGIETAMPGSTAASGWAWTCGPCSISACANRPVGTPCGLGRYCVVTTICSANPLTERCVCGTHHA